VIDPWLLTLQSFSKIWIGFSGGLDSTVLLHSLAALQSILPPIQVIHINHGLSLQASAWQFHCEEICEKLALPCYHQSVEFNRHKNIEEGARNARYHVFESYIQAGEVLLLAHHADDQAETLLLQLCRGTGINGLAAMQEIMTFASGTLIRPLLGCTRKELEVYADVKNLIWIDDESNSDEKYSRNFLRRQIIPALTQKWPTVVNNINRTAQHCQDARVNLETLASLDLAKASDTIDILCTSVLAEFSKERVINCLRFWLKKNHLRSPTRIMTERIYNEFFQSRWDAEPEIVLEHLTLRRYQRCLYLVVNNLPVLPESTPLSKSSYSTELSKLLGYDIDTLIENTGLATSKLDALEVRFRKGGEVFFWHGQHKDLKKLFQLWKIPPWLRDRTPLLYLDNKLVAVLGYAVSDTLHKKL
jgi:tRNA(Ile)-lysidine synthase